MNAPKRWTYLSGSEIVAFARQVDVSGGWVIVSEKWMEGSGEQMNESAG